MAQRNTLLAFLAVGGYALWKNREQVGAFAKTMANKTGAAAGTTDTASPTMGTTGATGTANSY